MKEVRRFVAPGTFTLPFLVFAYALIAAVAFLLAGSAFVGLFSSESLDTPRGILLLVVAPFGMTVLLALLLFAVVSDSHNRDGARRYRRRTFLAISALLVLVAFPPTVIVGRYAGAALDTWFSRPMSDSLAAAEDIVSLYLKERNRSVQNAALRFFTGENIWAYRREPTDWLGPLRAIDPEAAACQVYLAEKGPDGNSYEPILETGDLGRFVPRGSIDFVRDGFFSLPGDAPDLNRYGRTVHYNNQTYVCAFTSIIPIGFAARRDLIADARERARSIDRLRPFLPMMGLWIFVAFCLPLFLMALIIAYRLASRLARPLSSMCRTVTRAASGDPSFRLAPHRGDECADAAIGMNAIAERLERGGDKRGPDGV